MVLAGVVRVEGVELGAIGRITDQWQVFAGYTHLRSEFLDTVRIRQTSGRRC